MTNYLYKISRVGNKDNPGILYQSWHALYLKTGPRQRKNSCGIDNETIDQIKKIEKKVLAAISQNIRSDQGYSFSPLKPIPIKKKNGKFRIICIPTVRDRIVQKAIQTAIERSNSKYTTFNGINFGFVKKLGVQDAVKRSIALREENQFVYKTDISAFFDNIDRPTLKREIRKKIRIPSLYTLIDAVIDSELQESDRSIARKVKAAGIIHGKGIRQGMPLSPLFANLYLSDLDKRIKAKGLHAVRYADDLIFFADSEKNCKAIDAYIRIELGKLDLVVPPLDSDNSKTVIYSPSETVEFLGIGLLKQNNKYVPIITDEQKEDIKLNILKYADLNYLVSREITLQRCYTSIQSTLQGYEAAYLDCTNSVEITYCMNQWARKAIHDLLKNNFGIEYNQLNSNQKKFLLGEFYERNET